MTGSRSRIPPLPRPSLRVVHVGQRVADVVREPAAAAALVFNVRYFFCSALVLFALTGCTETGDFGRPKQSLWNDVVLPAAGTLAAHARGEPVSRYVYTDDEEELRDRAWRFLMPAHERSWFESIIADLARTRVLPVDLHPADRTAYHGALMGESFRSPASRYRRISEDAIADLKLLGSFAALAARVMAADRVRLRSLAYVRELDEDQVRHAIARVAENRCLIAWVRHATLARIGSYRYALEHVLIEAPQVEAIATERSLAKLEGHRASLDMLIPPVPRSLCAGVHGEIHEARIPVSRGAGIRNGLKPLVVKD